MICKVLLFITCILFIVSAVDLVLQVDGAVTAGSPLCVAKCALSSDERERLATGRNDEDELPDQVNEDRYRQDFQQCTTSPKLLY